MCVCVCVLHILFEDFSELLVDNVISLDEHHKLAPDVLERQVPQVVDGKDL